jgi:hypothetical protein
MMWLYRLAAGVIVIGMMAAGVAIAMAAWLLVIAFGLLMPGWSPRRACTGFLAFIHESVALIRSLDSRR